MKILSTIAKWSSLLIVLLISGCGSFKSVTQLEEGTFLQLVGNREEVVLTVDENAAIDLESQTQAFNLNGKTVTKIAIPAGQHLIKLERSGSLVAHRKIYVSEGNTIEMSLQ